jgi:hypothetical protein
VGGRHGRGSRRACASARVLVHDGRGEGGADKRVPLRSERERAREETVRRADEAGPRGREGESERACERNGADRTGPPCSGRERGERERGRNRLTGRGRLSARAGAGVGRLGLTGSSWVFLFSGNF